MKRIWDRIHVCLARHAPQILPNLRPGAPEEQIRAAEQPLGVTLPEDVKAGYRMHEGQHPVTDSGDFAPYFLWGCEWNSIAAVLEMRDALVEETRAEGRAVRGDWYHPLWLPLAFSGGDGTYCLNLAPAPGGE